MQNALDNLISRGLVEQVTSSEGVQESLQSPCTIYAGFDPTADGLHIGHLLPLLTLARLQRSGHRVIALIGGATGSIGDPSGKSEERSLKSLKEIAYNAACIREEIERILPTSGENPALILNNLDWTQSLSMLDFLRDIGKHFSVNEMIRRDSVHKRLSEREQGISFTEFSYSLLQALDFLHLYRDYGCTLQIGGSDQWGNIVSGIDLIRRKVGGHAKAYGLTLPLLVDSSGKKFGKTESGAVWLSAQKTSPYKFYQFWRNVTDEDLPKLSSFFGEGSSTPSQASLAEEVTALVHGVSHAVRARRASEALFGKPLGEITEQVLEDISREVPTSVISKPEAQDQPLVNTLVKSGLFQSRGECNRKLSEGAVYINNVRVVGSSLTLDPSMWLFGKYVLLRKGKKDYRLISLE